jgi:hypothetical protein
MKDNGNLGESFTVSVYDLQGNMLLNFHNQYVYDMSSLATGMYTAVVRSVKGIATQKISIQK